MSSPDMADPANRPTPTDLVAAGQRKINIIWEYTQSIIALMVVFTSMGATLWQIVSKDPTSTPTILTGAFFGVIGFYFGRSNHTNVGGVGTKPDGESR